MKCEEQCQESFAVCNDEEIRQRLEKEENDKHDICEQHDSYEGDRVVNCETEGDRVVNCETGGDRVVNCETEGDKMVNCKTEADRVVNCETKGVQSRR